MNQYRTDISWRNFDWNSKSNIVSAKLSWYWESVSSWYPRNHQSGSLRLEEKQWKNLTQAIEATGNSRVSRMARRQVICATIIEVCLYRLSDVLVLRWRMSRPVTKDNTDSPERHEKSWSRNGQTYGTYVSDHRRLVHEHQISRNEWLEGEWKIFRDASQEHFHPQGCICRV